MNILDLFCSVDAFWQRIEPLWERELLASGQRQRRRATRLHPTEILTILIVFYAALFPMLLNTWTGVRAVNLLWLRAAGAMGADEAALFWKVIIPSASPFIITGLRQAFLRSWIAVVGAEMLAASDWGLGWVIFDAKEFLNADVMMASLAVIGAIGYVFERLVFGSLERVTVLRWGMVRAATERGLAVRPS